MKQKPLRGIRMFSLIGQALVAIQKQGLCRSLSYFAAGGGLVALNFAWKARLVWYWVASPRVPAEEYAAREDACAGCERRKVKESPSGFFRWSCVGYDLFPGGVFCAECGCWDWFLALLKTKNTRKGHACPLGKHPGQTSIPVRAGGCKGCGSKGANGNSKDAARVATPATLGRAGLLTTDRS